MMVDHLDNLTVVDVRAEHVGDCCSVASCDLCGRIEPHDHTDDEYGHHQENGWRIMIAEIGSFDYGLVMLLIALFFLFACVPAIPRRPRPFDDPRCQYMDCDSDATTTWSGFDERGVWRDMIRVCELHRTELKLLDENSQKDS